MSFLKKIPSVLLFVLLAAVYIGCGFIVGYHQGYKAGQEDYIVYINKLFEDVKARPAPVTQETPKVEEKK